VMTPRTSAVEPPADDGKVARGIFSARLLVPGPVVQGEQLQLLTGEWLATGGLLLTAVVVSRSLT
jgi:hypothetical protein